MKPKPTPTIFRRQLLTPADLDNHPMALGYIAYFNMTRFPLDFQLWLKLQEKNKQKRINRIQQMMDEPYCKSPLKMRVHRTSQAPRWMKS